MVVIVAKHELPTYPIKIHYLKLETLQNRKAVICGATPVVPVVLEIGHTICLEARIMPERVAPQPLFVTDPEGKMDAIRCPILITKDPSSPICPIEVSMNCSPNTSKSTS